MAITVSMAITSVGSTRSNSVISGILTLVNNGANTISVLDVALFEQSTMGAIIGQPVFMTPNVAPGEGEPDVATTVTVYYPFSVVVPAINTPGASPNAPSSLHDDVFPPGNSWCRLACNVRAYDATAVEYVTGTATLQFPVVSAVAPFPVPQGGAEQFNSGGDAVNWFF